MSEGGGLRVGTAERTAAMKALDEHLSEGRLGVVEYGDRSATAAGATTVDELRGLFTDLPAPHPVLPGDPPAAAPEPAGPASGAVTTRSNRFMEHAAPRIMGVLPILALALFFVTHEWWWFLMIPAAGALLFGGRHGDRDRERQDREQRRALRDDDDH